MTPSILAGAALDRACAEAMGWRAIQLVPHGLGIVDLFEGRPPNKPLARRVWLPAFSTDHATLPESFAWLTARVDAVSLEVYEKSASAETYIPVALAAERFVADGATLPEAVARLIVAVSLALAKEKP